ncbi:uncharacterized protein [Littorina saxatilis]|uniref:uncharacterized protein isoform X2 n=1 Tax=Littorina saxatilis TaxID=31220 RepID=UPI0038B69BE3
MRLASLLIAAVHCVGMLAVSRSEQPSCSARPVVEGQPGSVTCTFPVDVTKQKQHVNVLRYDFDGLNFVPELVLKCFWRTNTMNPDCSVADGFDFDRQISNTVTVKIPRATKGRHEGVYACDYAGAAPRRFSVCRLHVKSSRISCSAPAVSLGRPTHVTCEFNSDLSETKNNFYISHGGLGIRSKPEDVVTCNWIKNQAKPFCYTKEGYNFTTESIHERVTVQIPAFEEHHIGRYYCNTVPVERGVNTEHCNLRVEDVTTQKTTTSQGAPCSSWNVSVFIMVLLRFLMECA